MGALIKDRDSPVTASQNSPLTDSEDELQNLLLEAITRGASDVHIEPIKQQARIRFRVGNNLEIGHDLTQSTFYKIADSTKRLAKLSEASRLEIQEANFNYNLNGQEHVISLSVIPLVDGNKMVLHLSPLSPSSLSLEQLGFWGTNLKLINQTLATIRGTIIFSSLDRNSGGQTTLGIANQLRHPTLRVAAMGDPLVDHLHYASRYRIDPAKGVTQKLSLKKVLDEDPAVIFISEVLDKQTMNDALEAGAKRLVCINTRAQDVPSLILQLSRMELEKTLVTTNLHLLSGQRIVPRLCGGCRESFRLNSKFSANLEKTLSTFDTFEIHELEKDAIEEGTNPNIPVSSSTDNKIEKLWRVSKTGCDKCNFSGYRGYTTINEVLDTKLISVKKLLAKSNLSAQDIHETIRKSGMIPQHIDGLVKCLRGIVGAELLLTLIKTSGY